MLLQVNRVPYVNIIIPWNTDFNLQMKYNLYFVSHTWFLKIDINLYSKKEYLHRRVRASLRITGKMLLNGRGYRVVLELTVHSPCLLTSPKR